MVNYYHRFLLQAASTLKLLTDATCGPGSCSTRVKWSQQLDKLFKKAKTALSDVAALAHPLPGAELSIAVEASNHHVGGVLQQGVKGAWQPLAFFSRKLNMAQSRYSTFDQELLACVSTMRHFRFLVKERKLFLLSGHNPLTYIRCSPHSRSRERGGRSGRPPEVVAQPPGVAAVVPPTSMGPLRWEQLANSQSTCPQMPALYSLLLHSGSSGLPFRQRKSGATADLRKAVFDSVHTLIHPGVHATADIKERCCECAACQRAKITT